MRVSFKRLSFLTATALASTLWLSPLAAGASTPTMFSGEAKVLSGTVLGIPITLVDTGPVAASGGELEQSLICYPTGPNCVVGVPDVTNGALQAQVLHAAVVAQGNKSGAEASVAKLSLSASGQTVGAEFLGAEAEAKCTGSRASISGAAEIVGLVVNGQSITVTGGVNQTISLPGITLIINEQVGSASAGSGDITVNALHIKIPGLAPGTDTDLVVAQAHADILCGRDTCAGPDKVTGGGYVADATGKKNFAIAGMPGSSWGHFLYVNHATGDKMKATSLATTFDGTFMVVSGMATVNGSGSHAFTVRVRDNGEPGRGADQFQLTSSHGAMNFPMGTLGGGNIQFHKPCG